MSYTEIVRLRNLFERDTDGLLNQTQRLILFLITTYDGDSGCYVGHARLEALVGLKPRALLENMHHLTDGSKWEKNKRVPCSQPDCLGKETHLKIIKRNVRAYKGKQQNYSVDLGNYETRLSMHSGAPLESVIDLKSMHLDTVKSAPESIKGSATVHPYKQDKQDKQLQESSYVILLNEILKKKLPSEKLFRVDPVIEKMMYDLEVKGFTFKAIETALEAVGEASINNPKGYVKSKLQTLLEAVPDWSFPDHLPPHCGDCDIDTRKMSYRYEIPSNPPGATSNECPECNPYALKRKSA